MTTLLAVGIDTTELTDADRIRFCGRAISWQDWESTRAYLEYRDSIWRQIAEGAVALAKSWEREKQSGSEDPGVNGNGY